MNTQQQEPLSTGEGRGVGPTPYEDAKTKKQKMINKMLFLGYQMGYDEPRTPAQERMEKQRVNFNNVEAWCKGKHCCIKKTLNGYTVEQLVKVVSQFEQVYESFKREYNKAG